MYIKSRRFIKPTYILKTIEIAQKQEEIPKLRILYEDEVIEHLSLSRIAIFNDGSQTIDSSKMSGKDPLRVSVSKNFRILDARFLYPGTKANDFSFKVSEKKDSVRIKFDYINEGDGCVIELFHDGATDDDIFVLGSFKGVKKITQKEFKGTIRNEDAAFLAVSLLLGFAIGWWIANIVDMPVLVVPLGIFLYFAFGYLYFKSIGAFFVGNVELYESKMS
jgi:hypothetical protein